MFVGDIGVGVGFIEFWVIRDFYYIWSGESLMDGEKELDFFNVGSDVFMNFFFNGYYFLSLFVEEVLEDVVLEDFEIFGFIRREFYWDFFL